MVVVVVVVAAAAAAVVVMCPDFRLRVQGLAFGFLGFRI